MPDFLPRPDKQNFAPPFQLDGSTITACIFSATPGALQRNFLNPTLNAASAPGRFQTAFGDYCMWAFLHYADMHTEAAWGRMSYNEVTLLIPVRDTQPAAGKPALYWFTPIMILDAVLPIIAGRELWGFPKVFGHVEPAAPVPGPVVHRVSVEGFAQGGPAGRLGLLPLAELQPVLDFGDIFQFGGDIMSVLDLAANFAKPEALGWTPVGQPGVVLSLLEMFLQGQAPGIFLKQYPSIADSQQACYRRLAQAACVPKKVHGYRLHLARLSFHNPASFPLTDLLGTPQGLHPAITASADWVLPHGQEL